MSVLNRNNVTGSGDILMLFAHGYGCDHEILCFVALAFSDTHRMILFDHVGAGQSNLSD